LGVPLNLLCAGTVRGLLKALLPGFEAETGASVNARFGAVGEMREALAGGAPCDVMIVTDAMVVGLQRDGALSAAPRAPLGRVRAGLAVPDGTPRPEVATPQALRASLLSARAVYFADPQRSTAGMHFESVLSRLGLLEALGARLRSFPNGATAMRELAADVRAGAIGCTQIPEILCTPGIVLAGPLPAEFELATVYTAAVGAAAGQPALARRLIDWLAGPGTREWRAQNGFEADAAAAC
jgi:molybdate transport system substrate-binding protein